MPTPHMNLSRPSAVGVENVCDTPRAEQYRIAN
jgi:hypothetical protein